MAQLPPATALAVVWEGSNDEVDTRDMKPRNGVPILLMNPLPPVAQAILEETFQKKLDTVCMYEDQQGQYAADLETMTVEELDNPTRQTELGTCQLVRRMVQYPNKLETAFYYQDESGLIAYTDEVQAQLHEAFLRYGRAVTTVLVDVGYAGYLPMKVQYVRGNEYVQTNLQTKTTRSVFFRPARREGQEFDPYKCMTAAAEHADKIAELCPALVCPITKDTFVEPVTASDGYTYEKEALLQLFAVANEQGVPAVSVRTNMPFPTHEVHANNVAAEWLKVLEDELWENDLARDLGAGSSKAAGKPLGAGSSKAAGKSPVKPLGPSPKKPITAAGAAVTSPTAATGVPAKRPGGIKAKAAEVLAATSEGKKQRK